MKKVICETESAKFEFDLSDTTSALNRFIKEKNKEESTRILEFLNSSSGDIINLSADDYFGYVAFDLLENGKGTATCKECDQVYQAGELKPVSIGAGPSPVSTNFNIIGGLKNLFGKKVWDCFETSWRLAMARRFPLEMSG